MDQIQVVVETNFAQRLGQGNVSYYNNASTLQSAPVMLIGTAISTAAFPRLAARLSQGRPDLFRRDFLRIMRFMIWVTIPVVITAFFGRGYLAHLIYSRNSQPIALIFGYLTIAIFFRTMYTIVSRWFYARKDTKTPLIVSVFTIAANIALAAMLARHNSYGIAGLALSASLVSMLEVIILCTVMVFRDPGLLNMQFWGGVGRIISVGGFSMVAGYLTVGFLPLGASDMGLTLTTKLGTIAAAVFVVHIALSGLFGLEEARPIFSGLKRLVLGRIRNSV